MQLPLSIAIASALVVMAAVLDFEKSPRTDLYLDCAAWLIAGLALSVVVARAVFGPGRITYHRVVGAVLLYLITALIFVALYGFVTLSTPVAFTNLPPLRGDFAVSGNLIYLTLTTTGYGDIVPLHRLRAALPMLRQSWAKYIRRPYWRAL